jgi:hypothetical protein
MPTSIAEKRRVAQRATPAVDNRFFAVSQTAIHQPYTVGPESRAKSGKVRVANDSLKTNIIGGPRRREKIQALIAIAQDMFAEAKSLLERDLTSVIDLFSKHLHR